MYLIDARLEQTPPVLRILNRETNAIVAAFEGDVLQQLIDEAYLYPPDFLQVDDAGYCVKNLFLLACSQTLHLDVVSSDLCLGCRACREEESFEWRDYLTTAVV
ncbi:hypothetical protein [Thioflexithrix psekupsensis]|uniref:Uncharacterized protein n=1 Tax=Thioflexithrix psekupsensis TaxID=1570016 RepID=A0A251X5V8_9GAMM|nr:hypothetical protein [Thioflexithrix psekupsensis]OUD12532.1 hypothetical protein TPSD3_15710 [Thioflexithrix psekupsensis]